MTVAVSLVGVTMMDLWRDKKKEKMMMMVVVVVAVVIVAASWLTNVSS